MLRAVLSIEPPRSIQASRVSRFYNYKGYLNLAIIVGGVAAVSSFINNGLLNKAATFILLFIITILSLVCTAVVFGNVD